MKLVPWYSLNSFPLYQFHFPFVLYQATITVLHLFQLTLTTSILFSQPTNAVYNIFITQCYHNSQPPYTPCHSYDRPHFISCCSLVFQQPKVTIQLDRHGLTLHSLNVTTITYIGLLLLFHYCKFAPLIPYTCLPFRYISTAPI